MGSKLKQEAVQPTPGRLTALALRTLEEALEQAHSGPVKRNAGHRLALAWLARQKAGPDWHYKAFWDAMADDRNGNILDSGRYVRTTQMRSLLEYWKRSLRVPM